MVRCHFLPMYKLPRIRPLPFVNMIWSQRLPIATASGAMKQFLPIQKTDECAEACVRVLSSPDRTMTLQLTAHICVCICSMCPNRAHYLSINMASSVWFCPFGALLSICWSVFISFILAVTLSVSYFKCHHHLLPTFADVRAISQ